MIGNKRMPQLPSPPTTENRTQLPSKRLRRDSSPSQHEARWHNTDRCTQLYLTISSPPSGKLLPVIDGAAGGSRTASATLVRLITGHAFIGSILASLHIAQFAGLTLRRSATSFNPALGSLALEPPTWPQSLPTSPYPHYSEARKAVMQRSSSPRTPKPAFAPTSRPLNRDDLNTIVSPRPFRSYVIPTFLSSLRTITSHTQLGPSCLLPSHVLSHTRDCLSPDSCGI